MFGYFANCIVRTKAYNIVKLKVTDRPKAGKDNIMDIIERMGQLHSGSARLLVYNLGGDPMQIINDWQSRIGDSVPLAAMFGGESTLSLDDAANGAYWDIVEYAKSLYMAPMTRETAVAVANAITPVGKLRLADDIEFTDIAFADAWSEAHPDQPRISRNVDIG